MSDPFKDLGKSIDNIGNVLGTLSNANKRGSQAARVRGDRELITRKFGASVYDEILAQVRNGVDYDALIQQWTNRKKQQEMLDNPPPVDGSAKWATWHELKKANLLHDGDCKPQSAELYFGAYLNADEQLRQRKDNWFYWNGEGHVLTIAPTGAGKSAVQIIPNLLRYTGSCVVLDPKGELYRATSWYRSKIGKVFRIAPFAETTDSYNPMDDITTIDDATAFAEVIYPKEATGDGTFYEDEARSVLVSLLYYVAQSPLPEMRTLREARRLTMKSKADFVELMNEWLEDLSLPETVRGSANLVLEMKPEVQTTLKRSLNQKMSIWDSEALATATEKSDFNFGDLKNETVTVYITIPFHKMDAYSRFLQLILSSALEAMVENEKRPKEPVLFIIDEFLSLGYFPKFVNALRTHRDAGVRLWFIMQSRADMERLYRDSWKVFFSNAMVKSYFGVRDHDTAQTVSEVLGRETIAYDSGSVSSGFSSNEKEGEITGGMSTNTSESVHLKGKPLLDPREIQRFLSSADEDGTRFAIMDFAGVDPAQAIFLPWYKGYNFLCRFGNRDTPLTSSPILLKLWTKFNRDFFDNRLSGISAIGTVDFSMGRDGYILGRKDIRGFYEAEYNRIIFISASQPVIDALESPETSEEAAIKKDAAFSYLAPILLHEMLHQDTINRTGDVWENHGLEFFKTAMSVYEKLAFLPVGFDWPQPQPETVEQWPPFPTLTDTLKQVT